VLNECDYFNLAKWEGRKCRRHYVKFCGEQNRQVLSAATAVAAAASVSTSSTAATTRTACWQ